MRRHHQELMKRARNWIKKYGCPLPLDLAVEFLQAGLDVDTIETQLLAEQ
jgi:hypothetical protein